MKILFATAPAENTISSEIPDAIRAGGNLPPLGLLSLVAVAGRTGHQVEFIDAAAAELTARDIAAKAAELSADVVGLSTTTLQLVDAAATLQAVKRALPQALTLLGGPHVTVFPEAAAGLAGVDAVFADESEEALTEFLRMAEKGLPDSAPAGVLFEKNGKIIRGDGPCKPADLDALPWPDRTVLDRSLYDDAIVGTGPLATAATSRGCPFACRFCSTPGPPVRLRDPIKVADELAELAEQGFREVYFVDDTINLDPKRAEALCDELIRRRLPLTFSCRARLDRLTTSLVEKLRPAGCRRVQLGVEAATQEALDLLGKNITPMQTRAAVRLLKSRRVPTAAYYLLGLPTDRGIDDLRRTVRYAVELDTDYAVFNVLVPYPGTEIFTMGVEKGLFDAACWERFAAAPDPSFTPPVWNEFLDAQTLYRELKRAYRVFYLRPKVFARQLARLRPQNAAALFSRALDVVRR